MISRLRSSFDSSHQSLEFWRQYQVFSGNSTLLTLLSLDDFQAVQKAIMDERTLGVDVKFSRVLQILTDRCFCGKKPSSDEYEDLYHRLTRQTNSKASTRVVFEFLRHLDSYGSVSPRDPVFFKIVADLIESLIKKNQDWLREHQILEEHGSQKQLATVENEEDTPFLQYLWTTFDRFNQLGCSPPRLEYAFVGLELVKRLVQMNRSKDAWAVWQELDTSLKESEPEIVKAVLITGFRVIQTRAGLNLECWELYRRCRDIGFLLPQIVVMAMKAAVNGPLSPYLQFYPRHYELQSIRLPTDRVKPHDQPFLQILSDCHTVGIKAPQNLVLRALQIYCRLGHLSLVVKLKAFFHFPGKLSKIYISSLSPSKSCDKLLNLFDAKLPKPIHSPATKPLLYHLRRLKSASNFDKSFPPEVSGLHRSFTLDLDTARLVLQTVVETEGHSTRAEAVLNVCHILSFHPSDIWKTTYLLSEWFTDTNSIIVGSSTRDPLKIARLMSILSHYFERKFELKDISKDSLVKLLEIFALKKQWALCFETYIAGLDFRIRYGSNLGGLLLKMGMEPMQDGDFDKLDIDFWRMVIRRYLSVQYSPDLGVMDRYFEYLVRDGAWDEISDRAQVLKRINVDVYDLIGRKISAFGARSDVDMEELCLNFMRVLEGSPLAPVDQGFDRQARNFDEGKSSYDYLLLELVRNNRFFQSMVLFKLMVSRGLIQDDKGYDEHLRGIGRDPPIWTSDSDYIPFESACQLASEYRSMGLAMNDVLIWSLLHGAVERRDYNLLKMIVLDDKWWLALAPNDLLLEQRQHMRYHLGDKYILWSFWKLLDESKWSCSKEIFSRLFARKESLRTLLVFGSSVTVRRWQDFIYFGELLGYCKPGVVDKLAVTSTLEKDKFCFSAFRCLLRASTDDYYAVRETFPRCSSENWASDIFSRSVQSYQNSIFQTSSRDSLMSFWGFFTAAAFFRYVSRVTFGRLLWFFLEQADSIENGIKAVHHDIRRGMVRVRSTFWFDLFHIAEKQSISGDKVDQIYQCMLSFYKESLRDTKHRESFANAFLSALRYYVKVGSQDKVKIVLKDMEHWKVELDVKQYRKLIKWCADGRRVELTLLILKRLLKSAPDFRDAVTTEMSLKALANSFGNESMVDRKELKAQLWSLYGYFTQHGTEPSATSLPHLGFLAVKLEDEAFLRTLFAMVDRTKSSNTTAEFLGNVFEAMTAGTSDSIAKLGRDNFLLLNDSNALTVFMASRIARGCARRKDGELMLALVNLLRSSTPNLEDSTMDPNDLYGVIAAFFLNTQHDVAKATLLSADIERYETKAAWRFYIHFLRYYFRKGYIHDAMSLYRPLALSSRPTQDMLMDMISCLRRGNDSDFSALAAGIELYQDMLRFGMHVASSTFVQLLEMAAICGDYEQLKFFYGKANADEIIDASALALVVEALRKAPKSATCDRMFQYLLEEARLNGWENDSNFFGACMKYLGRHRGIDEVWKIFKARYAECSVSIEADQGILRALVGAFVYNKSFAKLKLDVVPEMFSRFKTIPSLVLQDITIAFCRAGYLDDARNLLRRMNEQNLSYDPWIYAWLFYCAKRSNDIEHVAIFDKKLKEFFDRDSLWSVPCLEKLLQIGTHFSDIPSIQYWLSGFKEHSVSTFTISRTVFRSLLYNLGENASAPDILNVFKLMENMAYEVRAEEFDVVLVGLFSAKRYKIVGVFFRKLLTDGLTPTTTAMSIYIRSLLHDGQLISAYSVMNQMKKIGYHLSSDTAKVYVNCIHTGSESTAYGLKGGRLSLDVAAAQVKIVLSLWRELYSKPSVIKLPEVMAALTQSILNMLAKYGDYELGFSVFKEIRNLESVWAKSEDTAHLSKVLSNRRQILRNQSAMIECGQRSGSLPLAIKWWRKALKTFNSLQSACDPAFEATISNILDAYQYHGDLAGLTKEWSDLKEMEADGTVKLNENHHLTLIEGLIRFGEGEVAVNILTKDMVARGLRHSGKTFRNTLNLLREFQQDALVRQVEQFEAQAMALFDRADPKK